MSVTIPVSMGPQVRLDLVDIAIDEWAGTIDFVVYKDGTKIGWAPRPPQEARAFAAKIIAACNRLELFTDSALDDALDGDVTMNDADSDTLARTFAPLMA